MEKRKITLKVESTERMVELMEKLETLDLDLEAEARPGEITIDLHGTKEGIRKSFSKLHKLGVDIKTQG